MAHDITIDGALYISSKRASELTGYTQDYVGQLARGGKVIARRIGGLWYVLQDSVMGHKSVSDSYVPVPPQRSESAATVEDNTFVTFDGKTYVSASQAAKVTSYNQDYIGQLARSGKILSRQVGNRWYVDIDGLKQHKEEKDALLGGVQASAVGLWRREEDALRSNASSSSALSSDRYKQHFRYTSEAHPLMPSLKKKNVVATYEAVDVARQDEAGPDSEMSEAHMIPIRVIHRASGGVTAGVAGSYQMDAVTKGGSTLTALEGVRLPEKSTIYKGFTVAAILALIVLAYNVRLFDPTLYSRTISVRGVGLAGSMEDSAVVKQNSFADVIRNLFSRTLEFDRSR